MDRKSTIEHGIAKSLTPVDPHLFTSNVTSYLNTVGVMVSSDTPLVLDKLCKLFNYSIDNPHIGGLLNKKNILIFPAQTGIGKSVSVQQYVSMLREESSLIVVRTIAEATEYCTRINQFRGQSRYARFYVSKKTNDVNQVSKSDKNTLPTVQCLVITSEQFIQLQSHDADTLHYFKTYEDINSRKTQSRELVVIDERLDLLTKNHLKFNDLDKLSTFLRSISVKSTVQDDDEVLSGLYKSLKSLVELINTNAKSDCASIIESLSIESALHKQNLPVRIDFDAIYDVVKARIDEISSELALLIKTDKIVTEANKSVTSTLELIYTILQPTIADDLVTHKGIEEIYQPFAIYNKDLYSTKTTFAKFGTAVVLDATAEVNKFYPLAANSQSYIDIVDAPKIRKYANLTIYKAYGFSQSNYAIIGNAENKAKDSAKLYTDVINQILCKDDKLLVITFKDFVPHLKASLDSNQVVFTHWGMHVGRNDWSDCNKVILIGWLRKSEEEYIAKLFNINSSGTMSPYSEKAVTKDTVSDLKISEIADDLIQGAMRCCARIITTYDSDCKSASVYLFNDTLDGSDKVIDIFESQFNGAVIKPWIPATSRPNSSLSVPNQKKENVIQHLILLSKTHDAYSRSEVLDETNTPKGTMAKWTKHGYFADRLRELGFKVESVGNKSARFVFR